LTKADKHAATHGLYQIKHDMHFDDCFIMILLRRTVGCWDLIYKTYYELSF